MILRKLGIFLIITCPLLASCSSNNERQSYQADTIQTTMVGTVKTVEVVKVDGNSSWIGSTSGSIAGGLLGSAIGNGWGRIATSIVGSVAGSLTGSGVERQLTRGEGLKMAVQKDDGSTFMVVVVPEQGQMFREGDRVRIISNSNGAIKVDHQ